MSNLITSSNFNKINDKLSSKEQAIEFLKCQKNPFYFIYNYVYIGEIGGLLKYDETLMNSKFKRTIRSTVKHGKTLLMASRQLGKALDLKTPILKTNGDITTIENIKIGDEIFGFDFKPVQVTHVTEVMNNHDCYEIKFDNNEIVKCDGGHLWKVNDNEVLTAENIFDLRNKNKFYIKLYTNITKCQNNLLNYNIINIDEKENLLIHPYILGLWLGSGYQDDGMIRCVNEKEYKKIINNINSYNIKYSEFKNNKYFIIYNLKKKLNELKLLNNKHIPKNYLLSDESDKILLLKGLLDSNGNMDNKGVCKYYSKNLNLINHIKLLLSLLQIKSKVYYYKQNCYKLTFYDRDFYLSYGDKKNQNEVLLKNHLFGKHDNDIKVYIKSIRKIKSIPVKCISVDSPDHLFLYGYSLIPTHNSTISACLLEWANNFFPGMRANILNMDKGAGEENLSKIRTIHENLPNFLKTGLKYRGERKTSIDYNNGSRIKLFYPSSNTTPSALARSLTSPILYID